MLIPKRILEEKFRRFVEEDIGHGDVTTYYTIPNGTVVTAQIVAKEKGLIAGVKEASMFIESFGLRAKPLVEDGYKIKEKTPILQIEGDAATLLSVERTLLNLLSRMSGIATTTNRLIERIDQAGFKTRVASTRKTAPGLRYFDKKAVMTGGGDAHRWGLDDMVLIKDNHITIVGNAEEAIRKIREKVSFSKKVEVEVTNINDALEVAKIGADVIMLDNFSPKQTKETIDLLQKNQLRGRVLIEASGGITEQNILEYASTGVDIISLGELTHSTKVLDISLDIININKQTS